MELAVLAANIYFWWKRIYEFGANLFADKFAEPCLGTGDDGAEAKCQKLIDELVAVAFP